MGRGLLFGAPFAAACLVFSCTGDEPSHRPSEMTDGGSPGDEAGGPPLCDPAKETCALTDADGVFVSEAGDNTAGASRAKPVRSIAVGLEAARARGLSTVFVCTGDYAESVLLDARNDGVRIVGGHECAGWTYTGARPRVTAPKESALRVDGITKPIVLQDLELTALDATGDGASSVGVVILRSVNVTFKRVRVAAGKGAGGGSGSKLPSNHFTGDRTGLNGGNGIGGSNKTCTCIMHGTSAGGAGGSSNGNPPGTGLAVPAVGVSNAGVNATPCGQGGAGAPGAARAPGAPASTFGTIAADTWVASAGGAGEAGNPGQGGGGGGKSLLSGAGGGCGGCGGAGAGGGRGGGASIALLVVKSPVTLLETTLATSAGGAGGTGEAGEEGQAGGGGNFLEDCDSGPGGVGAGGGGGAGGTGGISAGLLHTESPAPKIDGSEVVEAATHASAILGTPGAGGSGGLGGTSGGGSPGIKGLAGKPGAAIAVLKQ